MANEATVDELRELEILAGIDPEMLEVIESLSGLWAKKPHQQTNKEAVNKLVQRIRERKAYEQYLFSYLGSEQQRSKKHYSLKMHFMFRNYFKIALRNLQKQKAFAFINVFGLSVGIACFCLLLLFAANEFSFDKFHKNAPNIYRFYAKWDDVFGSQDNVVYTDYGGPTPKPLGQAMKENLPDVIEYARIQLPWGDNLVRAGGNVHRASVTYADPSFFSIFTFPLKYGNPSSALLNPTDIVLTESRAKELFGTDNAVGKTVEISIGGTFKPFKVTAIAKDIPANSTVRFDALGSYLFIRYNNSDNQFVVGSNWHPIVTETFVRLRAGSKLPDDSRQLTRFIQTFDPNIVANLKNSGVSWKGNDPPVKFRLQPLLSMHTDAWFHGWGFTDYAVIDPQTIWILLIIAAGILIIACINFTTLSIGRSAGRSKEVGVRKVIGAEKRQIIFQFLTEAFVLSIFSAIIGLLLVNILLPWFNQLSGRDIHFSAAFDPQMALLLIGIVLVVGLLAGSYPALVLSNFKPIEVLKNKMKISGSNFFTRSLVTFQFALSIILIVSTVIILQQTKYLINKNPGFNKENVVAIDASETDPNKIFPLFKQSIVNNPAIVGITSAGAGLGAGQDFLGYTDKGLSAAINIVDTDYLKVLGMQLIAGRNSKPALMGDSIKSIVINETMMKAFGWNAQTAIGKQIKNFQGSIAVVTGVVKNFNYRPLSEGVKNQVFETLTDKGYSHFYVRLNAGNPSRAIDLIQKAWNNATGGVPMKYSFLDEDVNNYYLAEQRWSNIVGWAGGISIFLACLGLLGLAALAAVNRTKEIGVRKVLGATVPNIVTLLSKDFLRLIIISFIIASPVAWYFMNKWLQDYANRINISWTVFLFAGLFAIVIALVTISFQAVKAAMANPVNSLRTE